jgi:hypothetical protein
MQFVVHIRRAGYLLDFPQYLQENVRSHECILPNYCQSVIHHSPRHSGEGHAVAYWLRHYAANLKVTGSIPDEVIFLNLLNASGRTRP